MIQITPGDYDQQKLAAIMLGGIAPRPIALASTIDKYGNPNLSPFSCFNTFGVNPTTLIFSPSRRGRDNTTKHTFENIKETREVVINVVTYAMVQQISLASTEFSKGVNEFVKSGLTQVESVSVRPFRVKESPFQLECRVRDIIETSGLPGSANLIVCEAVTIHIDKKIFDLNGAIDSQKLDIVGRLGGNYYVRAYGDAIFTVKKPLRTIGIGVDSLPESVQKSEVLTGNDLGILGNIENLPTEEELLHIKLPREIVSAKNKEEQVHRYAKELIAQKNIEEALRVLVAYG